MGKVERARLDSINRAAFKVAVLPTLDVLPLFVAREAGIFDTLGVVGETSYVPRADGL